MKYVEVEAFGGPEQLKLREGSDPTPGAGQVVVRLTSIGMNHAELMGREGKYKLSTGEPPFTPGLEGGGVIEAVGSGVDSARVGQRVVLSPAAPRGGAGGTYRSHYLTDADQALPAPDAIPDDQLGAIWLPYFTAWGCLVAVHDLQPGAAVAVPAASSSVGLAAAQVIADRGATSIGLTTSPGKAEAIADRFDHVVVTSQEPKWRRKLKELTDGRGVDVFFDPVAAGDYLQQEVLALAYGGTIYLYGLLGEPDRLDVTPLIRTNGAIRGYANTQLVRQGREAWGPVCEAILRRFADGTFHQKLAGTYPLSDVQRAHAEMEQGSHIGKLVLIP